MLRRWAVVIPFFLGSLAYGQAFRVDNYVQTLNTNVPVVNNMYPVLAIPTSTVNICNAPAVGSPCTNLATTYTSATGLSSCPTSTQFTRPGSSVCVAKADSTGAWGAWLASGTYQYTITTPWGATSGPYDLSVGGSGGGITPPVTIPNGGTSGTTLLAAQVNLTGTHFATAYQTGGGNNGILNSLQTNQMTLVDQTYPSTEQYNITAYPANMPAGWHLKDWRNGYQSDLFHTWNTGNTSDPENPASVVDCLMDGVLSNSNAGQVQACQKVSAVDNRPGWSFGYGQAYGLFDWYVPKAFALQLIARGAGIHETRSTIVQTYGAGDTVPDYHYAYGEGGWTAPGDEGTKSYANNTNEDNYRLTLSCVAGCSPGSTQIRGTNGTLNGTTKCTTQINGDCAMGVGRYLVDNTQGGISCKEQSLSNGLGVGTAIAVTGCTLPVSNAWGTLSVNCGGSTGADNVKSPPFSKAYSCAVAITSGVFDNTHLLCLSEGQYHECVIPTSVTAPSGGSQTITMNLRKSHQSGSVIFQGGLAGYGVEFPFYDQNPQGQVLKYLFDVPGSTSTSVAQAIYYKQGFPGIITQVTGEQNLSWAIQTLSNSGSTVSGVFNSAGCTQCTPSSLPGVTWIISGSSDPVFNNNCTNIAWTDSTHFTCTISTLVGTHTAPSASAANGSNSVVFWPMAEVIDIQNEALTPPAADGSLTLEPNVIQFAASDSLEETHHLSGHFEGGTVNNTVYNPYNIGKGLSIGLLGGGQQGGAQGPTGTGGVNVANLNQDTLYAGGGGFYNAPNFLAAIGMFNSGWIMDHGTQNALIKQSFSSIQNNDPNYSENIYNTQSGPSQQYTFSINYNPRNGNTLWSMVGGGGATWSAATHDFFGNTTFHNAVTLPVTGVSAGTYINPPSITLGVDGRVTAITNGIANVQVTIGTTIVNANTCTADLGPVTMTGLATTSTLSFTPSSDFSATTGWGSSGGLMIFPWPAANAMHYRVCNQTGSNITPGGSTVWNVSAR